MKLRTGLGVLVISATAVIAWWVWPEACERYGLCNPDCRIADNGIERFVRLAPIVRQSDWTAAGASPGDECLELLVALTKQFPDLEIAVDTVSVSDERVPKAFYQYDCTFDVQRPIYRLDRNALCPAVVAKSEQ